MLQELKELNFNPNSLAIRRPDLLEYWDWKKNDVSPYEITHTYRKKTYWICPKGHNWKVYPMSMVIREVRCILCKFYTYKEAQEINKKERWITSRQYYNNCKKFSKLPTHPDSFYREEWNGWYNFLGTNPINYPTYNKACKIISPLRLTSEKFYKKVYWKYGLPKNPQKVYKDKGWLGWVAFLGKYLPYNEVQKIASQWNSKTEYKSNYKQYEGLPSSPHRIYKNWPGWNKFLGKKNVKRTKTT